MTRLIAAAAMLILGAFPLAAQSPVPVEKEPRHRLKFENQYVRVFDVVVLPGDTTLFHTHSHDYVFVTIGDADLIAEALGAQPADLLLKNGEVRFSKAPITHRVSNPSNVSRFRNITIEILKSAGRAAASKLDTSPGLTTVLDNDRVHVERLVLEPGQSTSLHTHGLSALSVFLTEAKVLVESPGQKPQTIEYKPGEFRWRDAPVTHTIKNIGSTRFEAVGVDWK